MGRAIVRQPQVFLMDEPLSNLDAKLRVQTRTQIASLQRRLGVTTVYVTHDQVEAMTMGDRVAVLKDGLLQQVRHPARAVRPPEQRLRRRLHRLARDEPARRAGRRRRRQVRRRRRARSTREHLASAGKQVTVGVRPEDLEHRRPTATGLPVTVDVVEELGADAYVYGSATDESAASATADRRPRRRPHAPAEGQT